MHMARYSRALTIALAVAVLFGGVRSLRSQASPPPILLITSATAPNPFGGYLAEILRTEGVTEFATEDISVVTASDLGGAALVILAEMPLSQAQAGLLSSYVTGGGRLIAMRPDAQLSPVLGIG